VSSTAQATANPLLDLLALIRKAREAQTPEELAFLLVNESHGLLPYRQAVLWLADAGVNTLSGVVQPEANAPYVLWLNKVCKALGEGLAQVDSPDSPASNQSGPRLIDAGSLPSPLGEEWAEWLPTHGLWMAVPGTPGGGCLLAADLPWTAAHLALFSEWMSAWSHAWTSQHKVTSKSWRGIGPLLRQIFLSKPNAVWWKQPRTAMALALITILVCPVPMTVLAPAELVPANPAVIRAPVDGVIGQVLVVPNEPVKAGKPLFTFDEAPLQARLDVAAQALATAETEYRQLVQQALTDGKSKAQLAALLGRIAEKKAEADYVKIQLERSRVVAPHDGIALFDDPSEWTGKPVQAGERVMRIAASSDKEIEAWLSVGDAIPLMNGNQVKLYLTSSPLGAVTAKLRYMAHDAVLRPSGVYAYRVRATLEGASDQRIGLKGTAKLYGGWAPLGYWIMRRPLATVRQAVGV
jgi:HlyD family secretion protein